MQGVQGVQGLKGDKGDKGDTGAPGTAVAYAFVDSSGAVNETKSKNVADANVVKEATGVYCFYNLSFSFANVTVTGFQSSSGDDQDQFFQVGVPNVGAVVDYGACNNTPPIGAAGTENAFVKVYDQSAAALADGDFFIVFN